MNIGKNIRQLREAAGMSQEALSKRLNVTQQAVDSWERSVANPRKKTIDRLADIFAVTPNDLFGNINTSDKKSKQPKDLAKFLNQTEIMFDGEVHSLTQEDRQKLRSALEFVFYEAKKRNKRKKD